MSVGLCLHSHHGNWYAVPRSAEQDIVTDDSARLNALVARCAAGDHQALKAIYRQLAPQVLAVALRVVGQRDVAEEVMQEVFIEAWRRAAEFSPQRGSARAWLFTLTRSRAIDRLRRERLRRVDSIEATAEPASNASTPLEEVSARETRQRLAQALETIPADQRRVLEMSYFDDLSHSEIATQTALPLGTVKTRIRMAIDKLIAVSRRQGERA